MLMPIQSSLPPPAPPPPHPPHPPPHPFLRYDFLVTLLPFPQTQLSTDDFDGVLYNATNLAIKGISSIAAYGYLVETYKGDTQAAEKACEACSLAPKNMF
jgi:hypothetical protein